MSDALNELRRLRLLITQEARDYLKRTGLNKSLYISAFNFLAETIDARIAELEAQQAEPSDAEIEAWRSSLPECNCMECGDRNMFYIRAEQADEAVALMRRGRGDKRLREAAKACLEQLEDLTSGGDHLLCVAALRAALESRQ